MIKAKKWIKYILLIFVGISLVYFVYQETRNSKTGVDTLEREKASNTKNQDSCMGGTDCSPAFEEGVFAFYFHGYRRCPTCISIENNINTCLNNNFKNEIEDGSLKLRSINVQEASNSHFVDDFKLKYSTLIVGKMKNNKVDSWKALDDVWKLLRDKVSFCSYVSEKVESFMEGSG